MFLAQIVDLLLEAGSDVRHSDVTGMNTLDIAIQSENSTMVSKLLHFGAEIHASSWKLANGKADIVTVLLRKLIQGCYNIFVFILNEGAVEMLKQKFE